MNGENFISAIKLQEERKVITRRLKNLPDSYIADILKVLGIVGKRSDIFRTCVTCEYWSHEKEICNLANARPPANVIADGCAKYKDFDEIPF